MKTGINSKRTYLNENERNKHTGSSIKCRCGGHSFSDSTLKDSSVKLILNSNYVVLSDRTLELIRRKEKIDNQIKIRKARSSK